MDLEIEQRVGENFLYTPMILKQKQGPDAQTELPEKSPEDQRKIWEKSHSDPPFKNRQIVTL